MEDKIYSNDFDKIPTNDLNKAVESMIKSLNLSGGSVGDFDLYRLIQVYFQDKDKRRKINSIL